MISYNQHFGKIVSTSLIVLLVTLFAVTCVSEVVSQPA